MRIPVLTYHASSVAGEDYLGNDHIALAEDLRMLLRDGWRVIQFPQLIPPYPNMEYTTSFQMYEFIFEQLEEIND